MSIHDDRLGTLEQKVTTLTHDLVVMRSDFLTNFAGLDRRIATLDKVVSDQGMEIRDIQHNMTILLGVVGDQGRDIKAIRSDLNVMKGDLSAVKENMVALETHMTAMENRVETRVTALETRMLDGFEQILALIDSRLPATS